MRFKTFIFRAKKYIIRLKFLAVLPLLIGFSDCSGSGNSTNINSSRNFYFASKPSRENLRYRLNDTIVHKTFSHKIVTQYGQAFWALGLLNEKNTTASARVNEILLNPREYSNDMLRAALEYVYQCYPVEYENEIAALVIGQSDSKLFAMAAEYLLRINKQKFSPLIYNIIRNENQFPVDDPIIKAHEISDSTKRLGQIPPLKDLLSHPFSGLPVIFSLQRENRNFPGVLIVRNANGKILRTEDGSIFNIPQLARSVSALPGYITNGNTPQGVFSFLKIERTTNPFIGPTELLLLSLPFEYPVEIFFHDKQTDSDFSISMYLGLLPETWQNYPGILEVYYAGKAGRNEILAHGTTIDPQYYQNLDCYPFTPSLGCLTTLELWDDNGNLCYSDQEKLIQLLKKNNISQGYFVIINIDNKNQPVILTDIIEHIIQSGI